MVVINSHIFLKIFTPIFLGRIHIPILTYAYIFQKGVGEFNHQLVPQWVGRPKCAHGLTVGIPNLGVSTGLGPSHEEGTTLVVEGKYGMTSLPSFFFGVIINHEKGSLLTNQDSMESRSFFFFFGGSLIKLEVSPTSLEILLEEILHQLRLVGYPIIYRVLYIPGGAGFLSFNSMMEYHQVIT